ncbi:MAG: hypothetical protein HY586_06680 [Candidatus Omnitrophica bacterium]|nr:hypothetical protein [Candidatus Omnitrophota bacterium]
MKRMIICSLTAMIISGCATIPGNYIPQQLLDKDEQLKNASFKLVEDYLQGQKHGEKYIAASEKYGKGTAIFLNLIDYEIWGTGYYVSWGKEYPAVICKFKMGNQFGGIVWESDYVVLNYSPDLRIAGDKYLGLRIKEFQKTYDV